MNTLEHGLSKLNDAQKNVLKEYKRMVKHTKSIGLNLCLGFGKTLLSIVIALHHLEYGPILVVMSKTLLESWKTEIHKFFENGLKYEVYHQTNVKDLDMFNIHKDTQLVLTTIDVVSALYKKYDLEYDFVHKQIVNPGQFNEHFINVYNRPTNPFLKGDTRILYSKRWGSLIVDEIQTYTNINSNRCKGLGAICAEYRISTSGTMFNEPKINRILGYYIIMNDPKFPRTLPAAEICIKTRYKGFSKDVITRKVDTSFEKPKTNIQIITHTLTNEEEIVYTCMKSILNKIRQLYLNHKRNGDTHETRKFSSYLLAMLTYLRQATVCPLVPISKTMLDLCDLECKSELSELMKSEFEVYEMGAWLKDMNSIKSSRIKKLLDILNKHKKERVVFFTSFRTSIDIFTYFLKNRNVYILTSNMSAAKRKATVDEFSNSDNGVLLLTYHIGSVGLNIQSSHTLLLADLWWNALTTQQAIGRFVRQGQKSKVVNIYYFTSNTGVENAVFKKQDIKMQMIEELEKGTLRKQMEKIRVLDIIRMINLEDNKLLAEKMSQLKI